MLEIKTIIDLPSFNILVYIPFDDFYKERRIRIPIKYWNSGIWQPDPMPRKHGYTNNTSEKKTTRTALHIWKSGSRKKKTHYQGFTSNAGKPGSCCTTQESE
ncbi:hypothetical protein ACTFIT_004474 [Dictyostelium discoideum]